MKSRRHERMENLIQKEISELIEHEMDIFEGYFVTITGVDISPDFRNAKVYYSILGDEETRNKFCKLLHSNKGQIRFHMGNKIDFRAVPMFKFVYDENVDKAARIENILSDIKNKGQFEEE
jgi:ribosome-binding factor A